MGQIFQQNYIFRVPKYQRAYAWEDEEVVDFIRDIEKCWTFRSAGTPYHHFFGGVVSLQEPVAGSPRRECDVIDGQQRLATFVILVICLIRQYDVIAGAATTNGDTANVTLVKERIARLRAQFLKFRDEVNRVTREIDRIELSEPDRDYFKGVMDGTPIPEARESHKRLKHAFDLIARAVAKISDAKQTIGEKLDQLKFIEDLLEDCTVIHIVTDTRSEAYRLFQVLNDRGTSLTDGDLLRSSTLELLSHAAFGNEQRQAETSWNDILSDPPSKTGDFLRWYYSSEKGTRPSNSSLFDECMDGLFPQHKQGAVDQTKATAIVRTIQSLQKEVGYCRQILAGIWPYALVRPLTQWHVDRMRLLVTELGHTHCMPLLMAACYLDQVKFSEIVQILERFFFRYKVVCQAHVGALSTVYYTQARLIRDNPATYRVQSLRAELQALQGTRAPDGVFRATLEALTYGIDGGNKGVKYMLLTLEHYARWYAQGATGAPQCLDTTRIFDFANTTIEHVYPHNADAANIDRTLEPLKHSLGNLTVLGPQDNQTLGNATFANKLAVFTASAVTLNREIAARPTWTVQEINNRRDRLVLMALAVFVP